MQRTSEMYYWVTVRLKEPLRRFTWPEGRYRRAFEEVLSAHMDTLLEDLVIPAKMFVEVELWDDQMAPPWLSYEILLNGTACRLPLPTVVTEDIEAAELASSVYQAIHSNRDLLISSRLAKSIQHQWINEFEGLAGLSEGEFQAYLAALVSHCSIIERAREFLRTLEEFTAAEWTTEDLFEQTISGLDKPLVMAYLSEAQHRLLIGAIDSPGPADDHTLGGMLEKMREELFYELGLMVPSVKVQHSHELDRDSFQFQFNDLRFPPLPSLTNGEILVNETVDRLALLKLSGRKAFNPANGSECSVIRDHDGSVKELCEEAGINTWDPADYFVLALSAAIRANAGLLLNVDVVRVMQDRLSDDIPSLIDAVESRIPMTDLTRVLRQLLNEELSIRDLREILESSLVTGTLAGGNETDWSRDGLHAVRLALNRYVSHKYMRGGKTLVVVLLDDAIERILMQDAPLEEQERHRLLDAVFREIGELPSTAQIPLILTKLECRTKLRSLIALEFPRVAVLCYQDLSPDMNIQPLSRISWRQWLGWRNTRMHTEMATAAYLEFMVHGFYDGLITLKELEAQNEEELEMLYALGYNLFTYGKYEAAKGVFLGLTDQAPYTGYYWRALGAVNQQLKDYLQAIAAYDMAISNDEFDFVSYVYRGESQILAGNVRDGVKDLQTVVEIGSTDVGSAIWVRRAQLLLRLHATP